MENQFLCEAKHSRHQDMKKGFSPALQITIIESIAGIGESIYIVIPSFPWFLFWEIL